tara:strand:- start:3579 stop:3722 length:144 start_codon:yes stop_codon:yes gene_type:complete
MKKIQHNGWWFFHNIQMNHYRQPPWLWRFNIDYDPAMNKKAEKKYVK